MKHLKLIFACLFCLSLTAYSADPNPTPNTHLQKKSKQYRVLIATYTDGIPKEDLQALLMIQNVTSEENKDGSTSYYSPAFESADDARAAMTSYEEYGFTDMKLVKYNAKN